MVLSALFALQYGVFQVGLLGSVSRSVASQHALLAFLVGASASAAMAIPAEYGVAALFTHGSSAFTQTIITDSYTCDPVIEEICKLLPLALLLLVRRIRRSLGLTDIVVLSAAMGAGFGFTETALNLGMNSAVAQWSNGYWLLPVSHWSSRAIPGPGAILTSWLPGPSDIANWIGPIIAVPNFHLIWSVLIGFGLALAAKSSKWRWLIAPIAIWVVLDHAAENAELSNIRWPVPLLQPLLHVTRRFDGLYVAAVLAVASVWDRRRLNRVLLAHPAVLIGSELDERYALAKLALARWRDRRYLGALWAYILERRIYLFAVAAGEGPTNLAVARSRLAEAGGQLQVAASKDVGLNQEKQGSSAWARTTRLIGQLYILAVGLPSFLYYGLDGSPITGAIDKLLAVAGACWVLRGLLVIGLLGQGLKLASHLVQLGKSSIRRNARAVLGHGLGFFASAGALALGALAISASIGRSPLKPISSTHSIEYWLGSNPAATAIMVLAVIALIALAAPAALELLAAAAPELEEAGATESVEGAVGSDLIEPGESAEEVVGGDSAQPPGSPTEVSKEGESAAQSVTEWPTENGGFSSKDQFQEHFADHGTDFGAQTPAEYAQQANDFLNGELGSDVLETMRPNGDIVRYNPITNEFGVAKADGTIRTYFSPDPSVHGLPTNRDYFNAQ